MTFDFDYDFDLVFGLKRMRLDCVSDSCTCMLLKEVYLCLIMCDCNRVHLIVFGCKGRMVMGVKEVDLIVGLDKVNACKITRD